MAILQYNKNEALKDIGNEIAVMRIIDQIYHERKIDGYWYYVFRMLKIFTVYILVLFLSIYIFIIRECLKNEDYKECCVTISIICFTALICKPKDPDTIVFYDHMKFAKNVLSLLNIISIPFWFLGMTILLIHYYISQ